MTEGRVADQVMGHRALRVEVVGSARMPALKEAWEDLLARVPTAWAFQSYAWAASFLATESRKAQPQIITAWEGSRLVAVLPLMVRRVLGAKVARPIGDSMPSYLGILVDPGCPEAVHEIVDFIVENRVFDVFLTNNCSTEDAGTRDLLGRLRTAGWAMATAHRNVCPFVQLGCGFEEYLEQRHSAKSRQTLRRKERKLLGGDRVSITSFVGLEIGEKVVQRMAEIQHASWMERRGAAVLNQSFYRHMIGEVAAAGLVRVWILTMDEEDVAFVCCLTTGRQWYLKWLAFKLAHEKLSPGLVLLMHTIRCACEGGIEWYDFGHGDAEYKHFWGTGSHDVSRCVLGRGFPGRLAVITVRIVWRFHQVDWLRTAYRRLRAFLRYK